MIQTKVISFANNKGGSGKSTTCSNVGYGLTLLGKRVLLINKSIVNPILEEKSKVITSLKEELPVYLL